MPSSEAFHHSQGKCAIRARLTNQKRSHDNENRNHQIRYEYRLDKETLSKAFIHAPEWARHYKAGVIKKWHDIEHYRSANAFNEQFKAIERRYCLAYVRKEGALGNYETKEFECFIPVSGSHDETMLNLIRSIREQGFETQRIISHSAKRDCL